MAFSGLSFKPLMILSSSAKRVGSSLDIWSLVKAKSCFTLRVLMRGATCSEESCGTKLLGKAFAISTVVFLFKISATLCGPSRLIVVLFCVICVTLDASASIWSFIRPLATYCAVVLSMAV